MNARAGSQLQLQRYVNEAPEELNAKLRDAFPELVDTGFSWVSPLEADSFREYHDGAFLDQLGLSGHAAELRAFWPASGPRWDGLAVMSSNSPSTADEGIASRPHVLLVEAKSHIGEMLEGSPCGSAPGTPNRLKIDRALRVTQVALGVEAPPEPWTGPLYQNANRLAHLLWLRRQGIRACLAHILFTDDPIGPTTETEWLRAIEAANRRLGIDKADIPTAGHIIVPAFDAR